MQIYTSYFYQIRNFKKNMIPVSTAISDPAWYRPPQGQEYYIDKRGIICGLRYEPLIIQRQGSHICPCEYQYRYDNTEKAYTCPTLKEYEQLLFSFVNKERTLKAFNYCAEKFRRSFDDEEPIIVLMVYEAPNNPCSERKALQHFFNCTELEYPI